MRSDTIRNLRRTVAVATMAGLGTLTLGVSPAAAEETDEQTVAIDLGDLDNAASAAFDQFDPSLGQLTAVHIEADVSMAFDVCTTNLSDDDAAVTVAAGEVSGEAVLEFAGGVVANAADAMTLPEVELQPSDGTDDCSTFAVDRTAPSSSDSSLQSQSGIVEQFSQSITDTDGMAPYIGTGTVGFDWAPTSASNINQPSEWTIVFVASGAGEARVTYEYTESTTVENPPEPPPVDPPVDNPPQPPSTTELPNTGGPNEWFVALAGLLLMAGGGLIALRRVGSRVQ